jgi:hypothetical protein
VRTRRQSSLKPPRATAREVPKSVELEHRVSRIELQQEEILRRLNALQAQVDYLVAKIRF